MTSFNDLKRSGSSSFERLNQELTKINSGGFDKSGDDRFWKLTTDKAGNGYAVIRFLPAPANEDVPFVRIFSHAFKGPGGWYIENSLTTFGNDSRDPVAEMNRQLWNTEIKENQELVSRERKRKLNYYSNIYVVKDPSNPANEGKVFLFKYGKKIFDKIADQMNPQFDDEKPTDPFNLWSGANFKLKARKVEGYPNYDKSEFDSAGPLASDDDELERIWKTQYSLKELLEPKNFKVYDELKKRLDRALGGAATPNTVTEDDIPQWKSETPAPQQRTQAARPAPVAASVDNDDEDFEFFKKLAEDD
jgi:hypothetical protein